MSDGLDEQDIVGIYRLCGATTKKNILRLAFEESADIVDLSSMNVPDINVITSEFASCHLPINRFIVLCRIMVI